MAYNGFEAGKEFQSFQDLNGEDTFIKINLLYIAFEISELYDPAIEEDFDELCSDILEISLNEQFDNYNIIDIADGVNFIIHDSNYTVREYHLTYKRKPDKVIEELLALFEQESPLPEYDEE